MAAAAVYEQTPQFEIDNSELQQPLILTVPELFVDQLTRQRAAQFIGAVTLGETVQALPELTVEKPIESLHEAIHRAAEGNEEARKLVETNVRTDVIERTIKAGHVMKVDLVVDAEGKIKQHGQHLDSVQANSLRFAANSWQMRERTEAETRNAFRIEHWYNSGVLDEYNFVVFSRAADNMTTEQMSKAGFFTDTMSCAIQVTTASDEGLTMESAFVAGVKRPNAKRHDDQTVVGVGTALNTDLSGKSAAEMIDTPRLIHKSLMPNGVIDLVRLWDTAANGTFFGEDKPQQDYLRYLEVCREREQTFEPKVQEIVNDLIAEAEYITSKIMAVQRLHKVSEKHMVELAVLDETINPLVFGAIAADHIEWGRYFLARGNIEMVEMETTKAQETAESSSCPTGQDSELETGDCDFISKECPLCGKKNVKTWVTKTRITGSCGCSKSK